MSEKELVINLLNSLFKEDEENRDNVVSSSEEISVDVIHEKGL